MELRVSRAIGVLDLIGGLAWLVVAVCVGTGVFDTSRYWEVVLWLSVGVAWIELAALRLTHD